MNGHLMHNRRSHVYQSGLHLAVTFFFIFLPLIALLIFTAVVDVTIVDLLADFGVSLYRLLAAYLISVTLAWFLAVGFYKGKRALVALPIFDVLQSFPSFALFPLFVVWFGKAAVVTIFILIITMIWPMLFSLLSAQKQIRGELKEAAFIFGARENKYLLYVLFPLLFPAIVTGSIVAWGEAWEAIIAAEIIVGAGGVGLYLAQAGTNNMPHVLIVGILLLLLLLFLLNKYIWLPLLNTSTKYQQE